MALTAQQLTNLIEEMSQRCGELVAEIELVNGDEPEEIITKLRQHCDSAKFEMCCMIAQLTRLLVNRYKEDYEP